MARYLFLSIIFALAYAFLVWRMDDFIGPLVVILLLLVVGKLIEVVTKKAATMSHKKGE